MAKKSTTRPSGATEDDVKETNKENKKKGKEKDKKKAKDRRDSKKKDNKVRDSVEVRNSLGGKGDGKDVNPKNYGKHVECTAGVCKVLEKIISDDPSEALNEEDMF